MKIPLDMAVGCKHKTKNFGELVIKCYHGSYSIDVEFVATGYKTTAQSVSIRNGSVKDMMSPIVCGVGFIGSGKYYPNKSKCYDVWSSMLKRCYSDLYQSKKPTYIGCTVCEEWHNFQNFAEWFDRNYIEGHHLDKDIKTEGNRVYSPSTCLFVTPSENSIKASAKSYKFKSPCGEVFSITNLAEFCRLKNLTHQHMCKVHSGKRSHHKGWILAN